MFNTNTTLGEMIAALRESGGACMKVVFRNKDETPLGAFIVLDGQETTQEVLEAVQKVEDSWE